MTSVETMPIVGPMTVQEFIQQHPLANEDALRYFGIDHIPLLAAMIRGADIQIIINYDVPQTTDHAKIGRNATELVKLNAFFKARNIPFEIDFSKAHFGVSFSFTIWLHDKQMPFVESIEDFLGQVAPQCRQTAEFVILTLAYDDIEITMDNITLRAGKYQRYGLPPMRFSDSVILTKNQKQQIPNFNWRPVISPAPSMSAPSPIMMKQIPENVQLQAEIPSANKELADDDFTEVHHHKSQRRGPIFGAGPAPVSILVDSYNGRPHNSDGILNFPEYFSNGVSKKIPEGDIFKNYTKRVLEKHKTLSGKKSSDPEVQTYMKKKLGEHFKDWVELFPTA